MDDFKIKLSSIINGKNLFSFSIKNQFFKEFTFSDVKYAEILATALINKNSDNLTLNLSIKGKLN